jgi:hypothetical protein
VARLTQVEQKALTNQPGNEATLWRPKVSVTSVEIDIPQPYLFSQTPEITNSLSTQPKPCQMASECSKPKHAVIPNLSMRGLAKMAEGAQEKAAKSKPKKEVRKRKPSHFFSLTIRRFQAHSAFVLISQD